MDEEEAQHAHAHTHTYTHTHEPRVHRKRHSIERTRSVITSPRSDAAHVLPAASKVLTVQAARHVPADTDALA